MSEKINAEISKAKLRTFSTKLWNLAVTATCKAVNGEYSEERVLKEAEKFEKLLAKKFKYD